MVIGSRFCGVVCDEDDFLACEDVVREATEKLRDESYFSILATPMFRQFQGTDGRQTRGRLDMMLGGLRPWEGLDIPSQSNRKT